MIRKRDLYNNDKTFEHRFLEDVERIQKVLDDNGYDSNLSDCADLWEQYSDESAAGWLSLPDDDTELFRIIEFYI